MGSFCMGLAQMDADECAIETEKQTEVSDEQAEQVVNDFKQYTDDDLTKRIQEYIDTKLSNDRFDLVSEMLRPQAEEPASEPEPEPVETNIDISGVSDFFNALSKREQMVCADFYEQLKPMLPESLAVELEDILFTEEPDVMVNNIQCDLIKLGFKVRVAEHKIKHITPCIRVDFKGEMPLELDSVKNVLTGYGYKFQSKRKNSLYFVK